MNDRKMKDVPLPPTVALSVDRVFPLKSSGERHEVPNYNLVFAFLKQLGLVSKELMMELI